MIVQLQFREGTSAEWQAANPVLGLAEPGYDKTTKQIKIGDGVTAWNDLGYQSYDSAYLASSLSQIETSEQTASDAAAAAAADRAAIEQQVSAGAWTDYTATVTGLPTSGNVTRYHRVGNRVSVQFVLHATGAATGEISLSLPFSALGPGGFGQVVNVGSATANDAGTGYTSGSMFLADADNAKFQTTGGTKYAATIPHTWANTDALGGTFTYETVN